MRENTWKCEAFVKIIDYNHNFLLSFSEVKVLEKEDRKWVEGRIKKQFKINQKKGKQRRLDHRPEHQFKADWIEALLFCII